MQRSKAGARGKSKSFLFFAAPVVILLYCLLVWLTLRPVAAWYEVSRGGEKGLSGAVRWDGGNAVYSYLLGRYYALNIDRPDPAKAILYYRRSVLLNPLQAQAWVGLSRVLLHAGRASEAEYALDRAVRLAPADPDFTWEASTFWLMNGKTGKAVSALRKFILLYPGGQLPVYDLCRKLGLDNGYIIQYLLPHRYSYEKNYLDYLISAKAPAEAEAIWRLIDKKKLDHETFVRYINFLIDRGFYDRAETDWRSVEIKSLGLKSDVFPLIWNPDFEYAIANGGFGWIVGRADGVEIFIDDSVHVKGDRSLGVMFTGKNPGVTIARQVVRVKPGVSYRLKAYVRTESLTTTNGIFLSVTGLRCRGLNRRSDALTGTNFWRTVTVDFDVPRDCTAAVIRIGRERSNKLDNKITGTAWIDNLSLRETKQTGTLTAASRRP